MNLTLSVSSLVVGQELYTDYLTVSILMSVFLHSHYFGGMTES